MNNDRNSIINNILSVFGYPKVSEPLKPSVKQTDEQPEQEEMRDIILNAIDEFNARVEQEAYEERQRVRREQREAAAKKHAKELRKSQYEDYLAAKEHLQNNKLPDNIKYSSLPNRNGVVWAFHERFEVWISITAIHPDNTPGYLIRLVNKEYIDSEITIEFKPENLDHPYEDALAYAKTVAQSIVATRRVLLWNEVKNVG